MRLKLNVLLLSICSLGASLPVQVHAFDGVFLADREAAQQDRRDARQARRAKRFDRQEQQAEPVRQERREPERGYGYGYERRRHEDDDARDRR